jgi:hypothetical protein
MFLQPLLPTRSLFGNALHARSQLRHSTVGDKLQFPTQQHKSSNNFHARPQATNMAGTFIAPFRCFFVKDGLK